MRLLSQKGGGGLILPLGSGESWECPEANWLGPTTLIGPVDGVLKVISKISWKCLEALIFGQ